MKATDNFADLTVTQVPNVDLECRLNCYYLSYGFLIFLLLNTKIHLEKWATKQIILSEMLQQTFFLILSRWSQILGNKIVLGKIHFVLHIVCVCVNVCMCVCVSLSVSVSKWNSPFRYFCCGVCCNLAYILIYLMIWVIISLLFIYLSI